jgi:hypothetical protein
VSDISSIRDRLAEPFNGTINWRMLAMVAALVVILVFFLNDAHRIGRAIQEGA